MAVKISSLFNNSLNKHVFKTINKIKSSLKVLFLYLFYYFKLNTSW